MRRIRQEYLDLELSDRSVTTDVLVREEPEEDEEDHDEEEDEAKAKMKTARVTRSEHAAVARLLPT
jgi:hypothetical protein